MKNKVLLMLLIAGPLLISSCGTTSYYSTSMYEDGIYYRATPDSRAKMIADNQALHDYTDGVVEETTEYIVTDSDGNTYVLSQDFEDESYEARLRKFDNPTYSFYVDYGGWTSPWFNPWWGSYRYPYYGYAYNSWYYWNSPWYSSWYYPYGGYGWNSYYGWGGYYGWYDPWYYGPGWYPGWGYGPGHGGSDHDRNFVYGRRNSSDGSTLRREMNPMSRDRYGSSTIYTTRRTTNSPSGNNGSTYRRTSTTVNGNTSRVGSTSSRRSSTTVRSNSTSTSRSESSNRSYNRSSSTSRSSGSYSGGGFSGGSSRSGGGYSGGGGSRSGGGRR